MKKHSSERSECVKTNKRGFNRYSTWYLLPRVPLNAGAVFFFSVMMPGIVLAGCLDPHRPAIESDGLVTTLNSYTEGSAICIRQGFIRENDCANCREWEVHECTKGGAWVPKPWVRVKGDCVNPGTDVVPSDQGRDQAAHATSPGDSGTPSPFGGD